MKNNKAMLICFIIIVVVSVAPHFFLFEDKNHVKYDSYDELSFWYMAIVGIVGYLGWRKYPVKWASKLWFVLYVAAFFILGSIILIDKFIFNWPAGYLRVFHQIKGALNSPLLFLVLYMLVRTTKTPPVQNKAGF